MLSRLTLRRRCATHSGLVIVETRPDFESEQFLDELLSDLGVVVEVNDPTAPAVRDEAPIVCRGLFGPAVISWREVLITRHRRGLLSIIVLPKGVGADLLAAEPVPTLVVDAGALRCSTSDVVAAAEELGVDGLGPAVAASLVESGDGWPAWVRAALASVVPTTAAVADLQQVVLAPTFRRRVVDRLLEEADPPSVEALSQLAHLDRFSASAADAVGGFGFVDTRLGHLPGVFREPTGLWTIVEPLRRELRARSELRADVAEALVPVLTADGELLTMCRSLIDAGLFAAAVRVLGEAPVAALNACSQRDLLGLVRVVTAESGASAHLDLVLARVHDNLAQVDESARTYRRIVESSGHGTPLRLEAEAELLACEYRTLATADALVAIDDLRLRAAEVRVPSPTRLREVEAKILGQSTSPDDAAEAAKAMLQVASEWEFQHEPLRAARAIRWASSGALYFLGRHREAQQELARAGKLAIAQSFDFGLTMATKAWYDGLVGDAEAHATSALQAHAALTGTGAEWMLAYVDVGSMALAHLQGSADGVRRAARTARTRFGELARSGGGVTIGAFEAQLLAELGKADLAAKALDRVASWREQNPLEFALAEVTVAAAAGRLGEAIGLLDALEASGTCPADRHWRVELFLLSHDEERSIFDLRSIEADASRLGLDHLTPHVAPSLYESGAVRRHERIELRLLGGFQVRLGTESVAIAAGHASDLVKLLAVHRGRCHLEVALDRLWPDTDLPLAQRRLKNVVKRLRAALGEDAIERGNDYLSLGRRVETDLAEFDRLYALVQANLRVSPPTARRDAVAALELYDGPLLPDDLYDDRIGDRRREVAARAAELLDLITSGPDAQRPHAAWQAGALRRVGSPDRAY